MHTHRAAGCFLGLLGGLGVALSSTVFFSGDEASSLLVNRVDLDVDAFLGEGAFTSSFCTFVFLGDGAFTSSFCVFVFLGDVPASSLTTVFLVGDVEPDGRPRPRLHNIT